MLYKTPGDKRHTAFTLPPIGFFLISRLTQRRHSAKIRLFGKITKRVTSLTRFGAIALARSPSGTRLLTISLFGLSFVAGSWIAPNANAGGCHFRERPALALAYQFPGLSGELATDAWDSDDLRVVLDVPAPCPADAPSRLSGPSSLSATEALPISGEHGAAPSLQFVDSSSPHPVRRVDSIERPPRLHTI
jgi:hypothetical protein